MYESFRIPRSSEAVAVALHQQSKGGSQARAANGPPHNQFPLKWRLRNATECVFLQKNNIYLGRTQRVYLIWCFMPAHVMSVFMVRWCISVSGPSKRVWWNGRDFSSIFEQCILTLQRSPGRICMAYFQNTFYILVLVYILIVQPCQSEGRLKCFLDCFKEYWVTSVDSLSRKIGWEVPLGSHWPINSACPLRKDSDMHHSNIKFYCSNDSMRFHKSILWINKYEQRSSSFGPFVVLVVCSFARTTVFFLYTYMYFYKWVYDNKYTIYFNANPGIIFARMIFVVVVLLWFLCCLVVLSEVTHWKWMNTKCGSGWFRFLNKMRVVMNKEGWWQTKL